MEYTGQKKLELFAENMQLIKGKFTWQNAMTRRLAALLYAQAGKTVDCEAIRQCHTLIKQSTGAFSVFRGDMVLGVAALLSLTSEPQTVFSETLKVYDLLKGAKFHPSDFLAIAAYQIAAQAAGQSEAPDYQNVVARTRSFYEGMKARHFFNTGQDDYIFAAMLGLTDLSATSGTERIEQLYSRLKDEFWDKNSVQTLTQVLVLGDSEADIVKRVLALRDALRAQKARLDKTYTLPILGVLALLPMEVDTIARDIGVAQAALKDKKGFGTLSVTAQERLLFAAAIVAGDYARVVKDGIVTAVLSTSISNIIIAEQAAMIAAISASIVAVSATASS